jgi:circadian clock protein KaiB
MTESSDPKIDRSAREVVATDEATYQLTLFVSGASEPSARAIVDARRLCEMGGPGRYQLVVVDVHDEPDAAVASDILATPTLIKHRPLPVRRVVGDLSDFGKVSAALGLSVGNAGSIRSSG